MKPRLHSNVIVIATFIDDPDEIEVFNTNSITKAKKAVIENLEGDFAGQTIDEAYSFKKVRLQEVV